MRTHTLTCNIIGTNSSRRIYYRVTWTYYIKIYILTYTTQVNNSVFCTHTHTSIYCTIGGELTWPRTSVCSIWSCFWYRYEENLHGMIALLYKRDRLCYKTADRQRGSTMNSVTIYYIMIILYVCNETILFDWIFVTYILLCLDTRGGARVSFRTINITMQTALSLGIC